VRIGLCFPCCRTIFARFPIRSRLGPASILTFNCWPGYGWSEAPTIPGYDVQKVANLMVNLMETLGYKQYVVQGGDWGHLVAAYMAIIDSQRCLAIHLNMVRYTPSSPRFEIRLKMFRWRLTPKTLCLKPRWHSMRCSKGTFFPPDRSVRQQQHQLNQRMNTDGG